MHTLIPTLRGSVKVEVFDKERLLYTATNPNTLVLESPKLLLTGLIPPELAVGAGSFTAQTGRPAITPPGNVWDDPRHNHAVSYLILGYYEDPPLPSITVSATDTAMQSPDTIAKKLTSVELGEYSVDFICSFQVQAGQDTYKYIEAGLLCPALSTSMYDNITGAPDPEVNPTTYNIADQVLFAHQTYDSVQANVGNTIKYTWTITMQAPT
jgi:hypothetical protein